MRTAYTKTRILAFHNVWRYICIQKKLFDVYGYFLVPWGHIVLGHSRTIISVTRLGCPVKGIIFRKCQYIRSLVQGEGISSSIESSNPRAENDVSSIYFITGNHSIYTTTKGCNMEWPLHSSSGVFTQAVTCTKWTIYYAHTSSSTYITHRHFLLITPYILSQAVMASAKRLLYILLKAKVFLRTWTTEWFKPKVFL